MPPPASKASNNKSFMRGDPNAPIPRLLSTWDVPMTPSNERRVYTDVMSKDIGALHDRVRTYINRNTTEKPPGNEYLNEL